MTIEFRCGGCGQLLQAADGAAGRIAQCPQCGVQTPVPQIIQATSLPDPQESESSAGGYRPAALNQSPNPYASPYADIDDRRAGELYSEARRRVAAPAICMMVLAGLGIAMQTFGILNLTLGGQQEEIRQALLKNDQNLPPEFIQTFLVFQTGFSAAIIVAQIVILFGAAKMRTLSSHGWAMTAAILSVIPFLSPCCCGGIPLGIWALIVLGNSNVRRAFPN